MPTEILQHQPQNQLISRRRDEIEIVRDILYIAQTGARKTRILYLANLNTSTLERYLSLLRQMRLLDYDADENLYRITPRGKDYIQKFDECKKYKEMHETILVDLVSLLKGQEVTLRGAT